MFIPIQFIQSSSSNPPSTHPSFNPSLFHSLLTNATTEAKLNSTFIFSTPSTILPHGIFFYDLSLTCFISSSTIAHGPGITGRLGHLDTRDPRPPSQSQGFLVGSDMERVVTRNDKEGWNRTYNARSDGGTCSHVSLMGQFLSSPSDLGPSGPW
jgi:hypothetical protein